ncbi:MAG: hypothetical protein ACLFVW_07730 [Phycisphaerae bacterium]
MRLTQLTVVGLAALAIIGPSARAQPPADGQVEIRMDGAVFHGSAGGEDPKDLWLTLNRRDGEWATDVWGWAWNFDRADHFGRILSAEQQGGRHKIEVLLEVDGDPWIEGDVATYELTLDLAGNEVTGSYSGTFKGEQVGGDIDGSVEKPLEQVAGYEPPEPGEHPRLLFRRSQLPELKRRAETDRGKKLIQRIKKMEDDGPAMGLMYQLTGEQKYADRCKEILTDDRHDFSGGPFNVGHHHGPRQMRMGMTLDLAWDGLDEQFRSMIAGYLWYYNSRSLLRPSQLAAKTNQAPGSNYMGKLIPGAYTSQAAIWDAPGAFPPPPAEPKMVEIAPPEDFSAGDGVPVAKVRDGAVIDEWLFAGPFCARKYSEDYLTLGEWSETPGEGEYYRHWGQDYLESLGGAASARPEPGTEVAYHGHKVEFTQSQPRSSSEGVPTLDVWADCDNVPCAAGYYYTVLEIDQDGWYTLKLEGPTDEARRVNRYLGDRYDQFSADDDAEDHVAFRLDADAYLAGEKLHHGDAVHLTPGRYPLLVRATTRQYKVYLRPRLEETSQTEAEQDLPERREQYDEQLPIWEKYCDAYYRRPLYRIAERKLHRFDKWVHGDGAYPNESGAYHDVSSREGLTALHVYRNMAGVLLRNSRMYLPSYVAREKGDASRFAIGFAATPDKYKPAVLWAWQHKDDFGSNPVFHFLNYPREMEPRNPEGIIPTPYVDSQMGYYQFRNGWKGEDTVTAHVYYKSFPKTGWNRPNAGTFWLSGLGHTWAVHHHDRAGNRVAEENVVPFPQDPTNKSLGGQVTDFEPGEDGGGTVSADMSDVVLARELTKEDGQTVATGGMTDELGRKDPEHIRDLGIEWTRSVGADFSGAGGTAAVVAVADSTSGGRHSRWQMLIDDNLDAQVDGQRFVLTAGDGTSLAGTVISPAEPKIRIVDAGTKVAAVNALGKTGEHKLRNRALWIEGGDDYLVVMTLQKGDAPEVHTRGRGMNARVSVGNLDIRFDGKELILGK